MPQLILFTEALLACGTGAFIFIRRSSPHFAGLGWLSTGFASAMTGAIFTQAYPDTLGGILPGFFILFAFVLFHVAVLQLSGSASLLPRFGSVLLFTELVSGIFLSRGLAPMHLRSEVLGGLIAAQAAQTLIRTLRFSSGPRHAPSWFLASSLIVLMFFSVTRAGLLAVGGVPDALTVAVSDDFSYVVYLFTGLGFSLGFFWLSSTQLTIKLEETGGTDPLTGCFNRRHFLKWCEQERDRAVRSGLSFSVLIVDIDHFKAVNDTFGHSVGDTVICDVVDAIRDAIRGIDIIGRWGGEEFVVLLRDSASEPAYIAADRIRTHIEAMDSSAAPLRYGNHRKITVSIGVAGFHRDEAIVDVLGRADAALYQAKEGGRNRVVTAEGDFNDLPHTRDDSEEVLDPYQNSLR